MNVGADCNTLISYIFEQIPQKGYSDIRDFCEKNGLSEQTLYAWGRRVRYPNLYTLMTVLDALKLDVHIEERGDAQ